MTKQHQDESARIAKSFPLYTSWQSSSQAKRWRIQFISLAERFNALVKAISEVPNQPWLTGNLARGLVAIAPDATLRRARRYSDVDRRQLEGSDS